MNIFFVLITLSFIGVVAIMSVLIDFVFGAVSVSATTAMLIMYMAYCYDHRARY